MHVHKFRLDGYTDNVGGVGINALAAKVRALLVAHQLTSDLKAMGYHSEVITEYAQATGPYIASNATPQGKSANRRVVVTLQQ